MRVVVDDYVTRPRLKKVLHASLVVSAAVLITLGTLVVFTLDPCPAGAPLSLLPSFCSAG
jgi:succinate dehydrogenase / fumarate reductase membrane anchor subunit